VVQNFGEVYPELVKARGVIYDTIKEEEASFSRTLVKGIERFKKMAAAATVGGVGLGEFFRVGCTLALRGLGVHQLRCGVWGGSGGTTVQASNGR